MNPEAVQWLEALPEGERPKHFVPFPPFDGNLYSVKEDHERCLFCGAAKELVVIE